MHTINLLPIQFDEEPFEAVHIYRDSLRYTKDMLYGEQCLAALLLSPSLTIDTSSWFSLKFGKFGAGIWELKPGSRGNNSLGLWVIKVLFL